MAQANRTATETLSEMTDEEHVLTEKWFEDTIQSLSKRETEIELKIDGMSVIHSEEWEPEKAKIHGMLSMVEAAQEEFFVDQTRALRAPSQAVIDKTREKCDALSHVISQSNSASAVGRAIDKVFQYLGVVLA